MSDEVKWQIEKGTEDQSRKSLYLQLPFSDEAHCLNVNNGIY